MKNANVQDVRAHATATVASSTPAFTDDAETRQAIEAFLILLERVETRLETHTLPPVPAVVSTVSPLLSQYPVLPPRFRPSP